jgi:hypothetical protein
MSRPTGFARIPRSEFLFPECQACYFHNREPAICENCEDASEFEPADDLDSKLSQRAAAVVRFYRRHPCTPEQDAIVAELEAVA